MTDQQGGELAIRTNQHEWTDEQKAALAAMGMRGVDRATASVFFHFCQQTGLDPFARQVCLIKRRENIDGNWVDKWTTQIQIDGFRVIRDRVAARLGVTVEYEDTIWYDHDGTERKVWLEDGPPAACSFAVLKDGRRYPAVVRYKALVQTTRAGDPNTMWTKMDAEQLEKCAEAKALRRAFPNDLGGVYVDGELPPDTTPANGNGNQVQPRTVAGAVEAQASTRAPAPEPVKPTIEDNNSRRPRQELNDALKQFGIRFTTDRGRLLSAITGRNVPHIGGLSDDETNDVLAVIQQAFEHANGDTSEVKAELGRIVTLAEQGSGDDSQPADDRGTVPDTPEP
jgi:phage recombination protein Bet